MDEVDLTPEERAEELCNNVLALLPLARTRQPLEAIANALELDLGQVGETKKAVARVISNYLNSDLYDMLLLERRQDLMTEAKRILSEHLNLMPDLEKEPVAKTEEDSNSDSEDDEEKFHDTKTKPEDLLKTNTQKSTKSGSKSFKYSKLKDFKISGSIGAPGQKDKLNYSSLKFQIETAKEDYKESEIVAAVIRAITSAPALRTYLEGIRKLKLPVLLSVLRSHFREKDSTAVFNELVSAAQKPDETEVDFCLRLMGLRDRVLVLSLEEKGQYTLKLVQNQLQQSLFTGMKNDTIRAELKQYLRKPREDADLLAEISEEMRNEQEHKHKIGGRRANVNMMSGEQENLLAEIKQLTAKVSELTSMKKDFEQLKKDVVKQAPKDPVPPPGWVRLCFNSEHHAAGCQCGVHALQLRQHPVQQQQQMLQDVTQQQWQVPAVQQPQPAVQQPQQPAQQQQMQPPAVHPGHPMSPGAQMFQPNGNGFGGGFRGGYGGYRGGYGGGRGGHGGQNRSTTKARCSLCLAANAPSCNHCFSCHSTAHLTDFCDKKKVPNPAAGAKNE
jgi:hypothetical protein